MNFFIKKRKNAARKHLNDPNASLSVEIQRITFMRTLMNTI